MHFGNLLAGYLFAIGTAGITLLGCASYPQSAEVDMQYLVGEPQPNGAQFHRAKYRDALTRVGKGPGYELFITPETPAFIAASLLEDGFRLGWPPEKIKHEIERRKKAHGGGACFLIEAKADTKDASDLSQFGFQFLRGDAEHNLKVDYNSEIRYHPGTQVTSGAFWHNATACAAKVPFESKSFGLRITPRFKPDLKPHTVRWVVRAKP